MINGIAHVGIRGLGNPNTPFDWHNLTNAARNPNYPSGIACGIAVDEHANGANIEISTTTGQVWETFCAIDNPTPSLDCGTAAPGTPHPWVQITPGPTSAPARTVAARDMFLQKPQAMKPDFKNKVAKKPAAKTPAAKHTAPKGNKHRG
ncbi:hypothetical protein OG730_21550 [Streptomyces sp. NBC_01298]|uniref:hypothetical protein n=1 Tax=Streptomyces sp. NBC_01298 TaxID=2903817 RepID=UPI002E10A474|nr:hypothetical protein OG730_21550 [Streptomyces sp. NBC_01298]